jgi:hypothetical protein
MKNVCAVFSIYDTRTHVAAVDGDDDWGRFTLQLTPPTMNQAIFSFNDGKGDIELIVRHESSFLIKVYGDVADDVIDNPDPENNEHQEAILNFYVRAFDLLNNFILRNRIRTFEHKNNPIKWRAPKYLNGNRQFWIESPIKLDVFWQVDGVQSDKPNEVNLKFIKNFSKGFTVRPYSLDTLELIYQDVSEAANGREPSSSVYDTCLELLMHAQEIVVSEERERTEERAATVCAALITTASACEIFLRDFIRKKGTNFHNYIIREKEKSFSVRDLLGPVLASMPTVGNSLWSINPELANNILLLINARNSSAHKGKPVVTIKHKEIIGDDDENDTMRERDIECPIRGFMIYSEIDKPLYYSDESGEFGSFVWDVLALIEWLRTTVGEDWLKPSVRKYWDEQKVRQRGIREKEILDRTLAQ